MSLKYQANASYVNPDVTGDDGCWDRHEEKIGPTCTTFQEALQHALNAPTTLFCDLGCRTYYLKWIDVTIIGASNVEKYAGYLDAHWRRQYYS